MSSPFSVNQLRVGMVGMGMIFDETYRPCFESLYRHKLYDRRFGICDVMLSAVATRTGRRATEYARTAADRIGPFRSFAGDHAVSEMVADAVDVVCVASPDDRHFESALSALSAGKHVIIEKPSVLTLQELDRLVAVADERQVLAKVVYHKLLDPDHKKLRTLVVDGDLKHVNNGYCTLLEPKFISGEQFSEWIVGRNPGTYVAVHYLKLIDFTFGGQLAWVTCTGQRGLVGPSDGVTWDSVQLRVGYQYESGREAAFDIHTSWVTPDNFPGYVEQEVQFRFDNGVWNGHGRRRGVECTIEGRTPLEAKISLNNHYNGRSIEPWGERTQRGYGVETIEQFLREAAYVEFGGPENLRLARLTEMRSRSYNDLQADRQVVAAVQAMEAILKRHADGAPNAVVRVNGPHGGLVLYDVGAHEPEVLYEGDLS